MHTYLKQEKETNNPQHNLLPIVQHVYTHEHHHRWTTHKISRRKNEQIEDLTNYVDSYNRHRTFVSDKPTTPANHGESINVTLVEMSGIIRLGE
jgi:hypothetical protein